MTLKDSINKDCNYQKKILTLRQVLRQDKWINFLVWINLHYFLLHINVMMKLLLLHKQHWDKNIMWTENVKLYAIASDKEDRKSNLTCVFDEFCMVYYAGVFCGMTWRNQMIWNAWNFMSWFDKNKIDLELYLTKWFLLLSDVIIVLVLDVKLVSFWQLNLILFNFLIALNIIKLCRLF